MNIRYLQIFICLLTIVSIAQARTWTDQQGRTMEAELIRVDGSEVVFQKDTGLRYRFPINKLSDNDQAYLKAQNQTTTAAAEIETQNALEPTALTKWLEKRLVIRSGSRVKRTTETRLPQSEYIAFYFSASWCPPCRTFTPKLVDFYEKQSQAHDNFEIIFVSSDRNEKAQEDYMKDYDMAWPAVEFDDVKDSKVRQFSGNGIPCLVIVDREGNVIEHTYVGGKYKGPTRVMNKLEELL